MSLLSTKTLNALLLGERYAESMGVAVRRDRLLILLVTSMLAGVVTAFAGPVAFVGVAAPHLARPLVGTSDHRVLLPASALIGAVMALVAEVVAQLPGSGACSRSTPSPPCSASRSSSGCSPAAAAAR